MGIMTNTRGEGFLFLGRLAIDLAFTGGAQGVRSHFERLHGPGDLGLWLAACSLRAGDVQAADSELRLARGLREAIWSCLQAVLRGGRLAAGDVEVINAVASEPPLVPRLDPRGGDLRGGSLRWHRPTAAAALSVVARDALELFGDPAQRARVRECASHDCALVFYDDSRPGNRRWCSSGRCGDRMRMRSYRARRRGSASEEAER